MNRRIKINGIFHNVKILSKDYSKYNSSELFNLSGNPKRYIKYTEEIEVDYPESTDPVSGEVTPAHSGTETVTKYRFFNQAELEEERKANERAAAVAESKALLNSQIDSNTVEIREGVEIKARPSDWLNLKKAHDSLDNDTDVYPDWHQGDKVYDLTKAELSKVLEEGEQKIKQYHSEHSQRIKALL